MTEFQVHAAGTKVIVDRDNNRIGTIYPRDKEVRDWCDLTNPVWEKYLTCEVCNKSLNDERLAWAFWKHESQLCSVECHRNQQLARYACCDKAKARNCVCMYSTECPDHGIRCVGTHD